MPKIKHSEMRLINDAFESDPGWLLDFSDRTMAEFFEDEFGLDLEIGRYTVNGGSKMKRLRTFIEIEDGSLVGQVLRGLWEYREGLGFSESQDDFEKLKAKVFALIEKIEGGDSKPATDALTAFAKNQTLEELIEDIKRTAAANKPEVALDRLHTYCIKQFTHLLERRGEACLQDEPLNSRYGKYVRYLIQEQDLRPMTELALKSAITLMDRYNKIRNDHSLAHDNEILSPEEARYLYDVVFAMLRFIKKIDSQNFGQ